MKVTKRLVGVLCGVLILLQADLAIAQTKEQLADGIRKQGYDLTQYKAGDTPYQRGIAVGGGVIIGNTKADAPYLIVDKQNKTVGLAVFNAGINSYNIVASQGEPITIDRNSNTATDGKGKAIGTIDRGNRILDSSGKIMGYAVGDKGIASTGQYIGLLVPALYADNNPLAPIGYYLNSYKASSDVYDAAFKSIGTIHQIAFDFVSKKPLGVIKDGFVFERDTNIEYYIQTLTVQTVVNYNNEIIGYAGFSKKPYEVVDTDNKYLIGTLTADGTVVVRNHQPICYVNSTE
jgi:hypothetical protein